MLVQPLDDASFERPVLELLICRLADMLLLIADHAAVLTRGENRYEISFGLAPLGGWFKKGEFAEAIGRSRGGRTSKIHALADDRGRPVAFALSPGNVADITMAAPLLGAVAIPKRRLADKATTPTACANGSKPLMAPKRHAPSRPYIRFAKPRSRPLTA
jgi:hypothetical protein